MRSRRAPSYRRHRPRSNHAASVVWTTLIIIVLIVVFGYAVYRFRQPKETVEEKMDTITDIMTPDPESALRARSVLDTESREAVLRTIDGGSPKGTAKRDTEDDRYHLKVETNLIGEDINRENWQYEVWLLRDVPYDFINLGPMITDDLGFFYLDWEGARNEKYDDYTKLLITLEAKDGNTDPGQKYLEGEFGK